MRNKNYLNKKLYSLFFIYFWSLVLNGQNITPEADINRAYEESKKQSMQNPLQEVNIDLEKAYQSEDNTYNRYWFSYGLYNQSLIADGLGDSAAAEQMIDRAIELLKPLKEDAESQALLALELGYSTRFKSYWSMISLGRNAYRCAERAVLLDPDNLRTNLALAINDFFTPKIFGGGKKVERHLKKALQAPISQVSELVPNWGKPNVYELLVKYYRKNNKQAQAQEALKNGLFEFPQNALLLALK